MIGHLMRVGGPFVKLRKCPICKKFYLSRFWKAHERDKCEMYR